MPPPGCRDTPAVFEREYPQRADVDAWLSARAAEGIPGALLEIDVRRDGVLLYTVLNRAVRLMDAWNNVHIRLHAEGPLLRMRVASTTHWRAHCDVCQSAFWDPRVGRPAHTCPVCR